MESENNGKPFLGNYMRSPDLLVCKCKYTDHITPFLYQLHWLPVRYRIEFKVLLLVFKALRGLAPLYLGELLKPLERSRVLRSNFKCMLQAPRTKLVSAGDRAFCSVAPRVWNCLPDNIKQASSVYDFKVLLKTHLFRNAFNTR